MSQKKIMSLWAACIMTVLGLASFTAMAENDNAIKLNAYSAEPFSTEIVNGVLNAGFFADGTASPSSPTINYVAERTNGEPLPTDIINGTTIYFNPTFSNGASPTLTVPLQGGSLRAPILLLYSGIPLPADSFIGQTGAPVGGYQLT